MGRNGKTQEAPPDPGVGLINPVTVAEMVRSYQQAIRLVNDGYDALMEAEGILKRTFGDGRGFGTIEKGGYKETAAEVVRRQLHRSVWRVLVDKLDVWKLLSLKRAEELRKRLEEGELPPINEEEIISMLEAMLQNSREYAEEFALEVYEWLTPGNKSSERWEASYATNKRTARDALGKKVILGWMIDASFGYLRVMYGKTEKLAAVDRLFHLLDGKNPPEGNTYTSPLVVAIDRAKESGGFGETEYFKFRACQNGNLHLEFRRLDLVQKLNEIGGNPTALRQKQYKTKRGDKTQVHVPNAPEKEAERFEEAFYFTPEPVTRRMLELVPLPPPLLLGSIKVLEPSAGEAHLADVLVGAGIPQGSITCVEKNYDRVATLLAKGYTVKDVDFLKFSEGGWEYIYMNPPFNQEQDILHVMHAYKLLAPGGWLVSVMSEHGFTSVSREATYFRGWLESVGGKNESLPKNSFLPAGTTWDTRLVVIQKEK